VFVVNRTPKDLMELRAILIGHGSTVKYQATSERDMNAFSEVPGPSRLWHRLLGGPGGAQCLSMGDYVMEMGATRGATAAGGG
jgi:hypothetical protein